MIVDFQRMTVGQVNFGTPTVSVSKEFNWSLFERNQKGVGFQGFGKENLSCKVFPRKLDQSLYAQRAVAVYLQFMWVQVVKNSNSGCIKDPVVKNQMQKL